MNSDTEWDIVISGVWIGRTTTDNRINLIKEAINSGIIGNITLPDIDFQLVRKQETK